MKKMTQMNTYTVVCGLASSWGDTLAGSLKRRVHR